MDGDGEVEEFLALQLAPWVIRKSGNGRIRLEVIGFPRQQVHQLRVDEELLPAERHFLQHAERNKLLEVARCRLPGGDAGGLADILNAAVRLLENQLDQLAGIDLRCRLPDMVDCVDGKSADRLDFRRGPNRSFLDSAEDVENPRFPSFLPGHVQQIG